ncbi:MAG: Crp/Fnr family transcriptional regulator [Cyclobacteriaceae bacterium]|jgi:CRP/FNR family transcriptional regulator
MTEVALIRQHLPALPEDLLNEIASEATVATIARQTEILHEGQYVKMLPVVLSGVVKVYSRYEDRELLLYYIRPNESCVMSFLAGLKQAPSRIFATTEEDSQLLLLPVQRLARWVQQYPAFNTLFYDLYNLRYTELLETINSLIFQNLDQRIVDYLRQKQSVLGNSILDLRHREIAQELGTSREVITRTLKKLEKEGKVKQLENGIQLL